MLFIIKDNKVLFKIDSDNPDIYIGEFDSILVGDDTDYYDALEDALISTTIPSIKNEVWIGDKWQSRTENIRPKMLDFIPHNAFNNFYQDVRNTDVWLLIKDYGGKTLKLNLAVTMLINSVTSTFSVKDFQEFFQDFVTAFEEYNQLLGIDNSSLNSKSIDLIQTLLDKHKIPVTLNILNHAKS